MKTARAKKQKSPFVTLDMLGAFTSKVLLPGISDIVDYKLKEFGKQFEERLYKKMDIRFAEQEYKLKDYIDTKFTNFTGDLIVRLDKRYVLKV